MGISLFSSRILLNQLGVSDYGIYGLVGGLVGIFSFINTSMSGATSRYLTVENARSSIRRRSYTFSSALLIHIGIAAIILILCETVGLWFVANKLNIAPERHTAILWVYQLSIAGSMIAITQVPYNASLIAHERIDVYAKVEMLSSVLKLGAALLLYLSFFDNLITYSVLFFLSSLLIAAIYRVYCVRHFPECRFTGKWSRTIGRSMMSFSGWNLYSQFCFVGRQQGTNILLNLFGGTIVNAAAGIAATVQNLTDQVSINLITAARPQIIKQFTKGDKRTMVKMMVDINILTNTLFLMVALPMASEINYVLHIWLGIVPAHAAAFSVLALTTGFISLNNNVINIGIQAGGNVKFYSVIAGTVSLISVPMVWWAFLKGGSYNWAYIFPILTTPLTYGTCCFSFKKNVPEFSAIRFIASTLCRTLLIILPTVIALAAVQWFLTPTFGRLCLSAFVSVTVTGVVALTYGLPSEYREKARDYVKSHLKIRTCPIQR